ncbi:Protein of unknown function [Bacillus wiedmannii]|uniref:Uncharacterized protein n=1 Tax=Bacillus wiedmannii TaxID=1890302 RepID=A0A1C3ZJX9_9BACI|nr:Protein of unknown function [Bacillus wiedmannii]
MYSKVRKQKLMFRHLLMLWINF